MNSDINTNPYPKKIIDLSEADDQSLLWLSDLEADKELIEVLSPYRFSENKIFLIRDEILQVGLGNVSIDEFMEHINNLIFEIDDEEKTTLLQSLVLYILAHISPQVLERPENVEFYNLKAEDTTSPSQQKPSASSVLNKLDIPNQNDEIEHRDNILLNIENPTPTIKKPDFILPNTKPKTADVLKNLSSTPIPAATSIPATVPTAFPPDLDLDIDTTTIIDPFKVQATTQTPPPIITQIDSKLSDITGSATKESFKIMPLSETIKNLAANQTANQGGSTASTIKKSDPYREPIQ